MLDIAQHRQILYNILQDIFSQSFAKHIAFKGGTLAYFLYGLDRFSTDLDFDILDSQTHLDEQITEILYKYGTIKKKSKIILSYQNGQDNIKIDLNRKIRKNNTYEIINFFGIDMKVQNKASLYTNKLVALTERNTNRDIYDVRFFMKNNFPIHEKLIQERKSLSTTQLFEQILQKFTNLGPNYKILDGLGEVLTPKQKSFVQQKLLSDLTNMLKFQLHFT